MVDDAQDITDKALEKLENTRYHMIIFTLAAGSICIIIGALWFVLFKKEGNDVKEGG